MAAPFDSVLLIAFGGPTRPEEVRPFLANVTRGRPIPPERLEAVAHHYDLIGGYSPLNELTLGQARGLETELLTARSPFPVFVGMRNWNPFFRETLAAMAERHHRRAVGLILSSLQTEASWERYKDDVAEAQRACGPAAPAVAYAAPWGEHPLFVEAVAARLAEALDFVPPAERASAQVIFTAHSVPVAMAEGSLYVGQLQRAAEQVAKRVGHRHWSISYQSRSGNPRDPWLEPDIVDSIRALAERGVGCVVVVPIGFVCDHVEVLYDLDIEAKAIAESLGMRFVRAQTVNDHPLFIRMLAEVVMDVVRAEGAEA